MQPIEKIFLDDGVTVRRASPADLERVLAVIHDATHRVQEKGFNMWRLYLTEEGMQQVRGRVNGDDDAQVFLATRDSDGQPVSTFSIQWRDAEIWGDERGHDGLAGYVHMLAVHRSARQTALGERMLRVAEQLIAAHGRNFCRLDCWRRSEFLRAYYARLGYEAVEENPQQGILLWQKRVAV